MGPLKLDTQTFWVHERARAHRRCCSISRKASLSLSLSPRALSPLKAASTILLQPKQREEEPSSAQRSFLHCSNVALLSAVGPRFTCRATAFSSLPPPLLPPSLLKLTLSLSLQRRRHQRYERPRKRGEERERAACHAPNRRLFGRSAGRAALRPRPSLGMGTLGIRPSIRHSFSTFSSSLRCISRSLG